MEPSRIKLGLSNDPTALLVNPRMSSGFCECKIYILSLPEKFTPKDANVTVLALILPRVGNVSCSGRCRRRSGVYGRTACLTKRIGSGVHATYIRVMEQGGGGWR